MKNQPKKSISIKSKSIILNVVIPYFMILGLTIFLFTSQYNVHLDEKYNELSLKAASLEHTILKEIQPHMHSLNILADNPSVKQAASQLPDTLDQSTFDNGEVFTYARESLQNIYNQQGLDLVYIASPLSKGLLSNHAISLNEGFDSRKRAWYKGAIEQYTRYQINSDLHPITFISPVYKTADQNAENSYTIALSRVILNEQGKIIGVIAVDYKLNNLISYMAECSQKYGVFLTWFSSRTHREIWSMTRDSSQQLSLKELGQELGYEDKTLDALVESLISDKSTHFLGKTSRGGAVLQSQLLEQTPWGILIYIPEAPLTAAVIANIGFPMLLTLLFYSLLQIITYIINKRTIIKPIVLAGQHIQDLAEREADLNFRFPVHSMDEMGILLSNFNAFVQRLGGIIAKLRHGVESTYALQDGVSLASTNTVAAIEQINESTNELQREVERISGTIDANNSSIQKISNNIGAMDSEIMNQAGMVEESTAAITEMIASLKNVQHIANAKIESTEKLSNSAEKGKSQMNSVNQQFEKLAGTIEDIKKMAQAINAIAAQTNLLSMNAAIEAAHAGESGKGFAVVAQEIRNLADSAGKSASSISSNIKSVSQAMHETRENNTVLTAFFTKLEEEVHGTVNAFLEINGSINELSIGGQQVLEASQEISNVTSSVSTASKNINSEVERMLQSSGELSKSSGSIVNGMTSINGGTQDIVGSMRTIQTQIASLGSEIDSIKLSFDRFEISETPEIGEELRN